MKKKDLMLEIARSKDTLSWYRETLAKSEAQVVALRKGQTKKHSLYESLLNILIGYVIAISAQCVIFPLFGIHVPMSQHLAIGGLFTVVSLVRSYYLRRFFNWLHARKHA